MPRARILLRHRTNAFRQVCGPFLWNPEDQMAYMIFHVFSCCSWSKLVIDYTSVSFQLTVIEDFTLNLYFCFSAIVSFQSYTVDLSQNIDMGYCIIHFPFHCSCKRSIFSVIRFWIKKNGLTNLYNLIVKET